MRGRRSSLVVRILLAPLIVLGPVVALVVCALLFPSAPCFYAIFAVMLVPAWLFGALEDVTLSV
ncbi:MAG: hypothetical protein ACLP0J_03455 [Solirubrobacteraceae bacterium]